MPEASEEGSDDLVHVGYMTLLGSYQAYHGPSKSEALAQRPLANFAERLPKSSVAEAPVASDYPSKPADGSGSQGGRSGKRSKSNRNGNGTRQQNCAAAEQQEAATSGVSANRGPLPSVFAGVAPSLPENNFDTAAVESSQGHAAAAAASTADAVEWRAYYRQCAEYFKQCEAACVQQDVHDEASDAAAATAAAEAAAPSPAASRAPTAWEAAANGAVPAAVASALPQQYFTLPARPSVAFPQSAMPAPIPSGTATWATPSAVPQLGLASPWPSGSALGHQHGGFPPAATWPAGLPSRTPMAAVAPPLPQQHAPTAPSLMLGMDEPLANLVMAWYWSGYYTGHYAACQGRARGS